MTCRCGATVVPRRSWKAGDTSRPHAGRGLCAACHKREARAGALIDVPRPTAERDSLLAEALILVTERDINRPIPLAEKLGMSNDALTLALRRAARAGDPRAITIRARLTGVRP